MMTCKDHLGGIMGAINCVIDEDRRIKLSYTYK